MLHVQTDTVEKLVVVPLNTLVATFNGPNNVIDKRFDKLLDYNNMLGRGKDEKVGSGNFLLWGGGVVCVVCVCVGGGGVGGDVGWMWLRIRVECSIVM